MAERVDRKRRVVRRVFKEDRHFASLLARGVRPQREGHVTMLVLSRKVGERILIGDRITVTVVRLAQGGVRLGIEAPKELTVVREELKEQFEKEARENREVGSGVPVRPR